jgi:hypothetical protein
LFKACVGDSLTEFNNIPGLSSATVIEVISQTEVVMKTSDTFDIPTTALGHMTIYQTIVGALAGALKDVLAGILNAASDAFPFMKYIILGAIALAVIIVVIIFINIIRK